MLVEETPFLAPDDVPPPSDEPAEPPNNPTVPPTMKAVLYTQYGENPKTLLQLVHDSPTPQITKSEVLVKVMATSINPVDWKFLKGNFSLVLNLPIIPCFDIAGVVVAVGDKVKRIRVGDSVYGMAKAGPMQVRCCGGCAEYIAISERCVARMPSSISYLEAASFPLVALTTCQGIGKYVKDGVRILVLGGSGGVGSFAVQYAKAKGCYVTCTCGGRNVELLQQLGADRIVDYQKEDWGEVLVGENYDVIFDCVGGIENWNRAEKVLKTGGNYVTISGDVQDKMSVSRLVGIAGSWIGRNFMSLFNSPKYSYFTTDSSKAHVQLIEVRQLIDGGFIVPVIDHSRGKFNFENIADSFEYSMEGRVTGKLVIHIDDDNCLMKALDEPQNPLIDLTPPEIYDVEGDGEDLYE